MSQSTYQTKQRSKSSLRAARSRTSFDITGLFAGVGGLEAGLGRAGHAATSFCEIDAEAATVLQRRFPKVHLARDVRKTSSLIEEISTKSNLLTAGFPCTDLSQAGQTKGFSGGRSSLIRDVFRLLKRRPFPNVLIENVPNWRMLHRGAYLSEVVTALEKLGYQWAYRTIDARAFGSPQRRLRIFLFASLERDPRTALFPGDEAPDQRSWPLTKRAHGFYWTEGSRGIGWGEDCVPTLKGGSSVGIPAPPAIVLPTLEIVTPDIRDAERMQGLSADWTKNEISIDGVPFRSRRRWVLVGNAVNVDVAAWIGENLATAAAIDMHSGRQLASCDAWPSAAWFDGARRYSSELGTWPVQRKAVSLEDFLKYPGVPLSERATAGFLKRYLSSRLVIRADFVAALEAHLEAQRDRRDLAA